MTSALVTVVVTTFNHEHFIREALTSVFEQRTSFPVDVVVIDDCSTDGTEAQLSALAEQFPGRFRVSRPPANRNDLHDFADALNRCDTPYVAMLDGDDFWIESDKLQRQVDLLEADPTYVLSCHEARPINADGSLADRRFGPRRTRIVRDDLWEACILHAGSAVFRRSGFDTLPAWYLDSVAGDWELYLLLTVRGDIHYTSDELSAYRIHDGGMWSGQSQVQQARSTHDFYVHQRAAWGADFRRNRTATLSQATTLAFRYGEAGMRRLAWRWLAEAVWRCMTHRATGHGPTRQDVARLAKWRVRADIEQLGRWIRCRR